MTSENDRPDIPADLLIDALEALSEGIAIYDSDERLLICNGRYKELLGPLDTMIEPGMHWRDLIQSCVEKGMVTDRHESGEDWISRSEVQRGGYMKETEIRQTDGRAFHISYHPTKSGGFVVTRSDITERRDAEDQVRDREALLTTILDTNPTPVIMAQLEDSRILYRSPAAIDTYGQTDYARDYFVEPDARAKYVARLREDGRVHDDKHRVWAADGREMMVSIAGGLTEYNGVTCVVSSVTDLTEQLEREALIRKVVESCPAPVLMNRAETGEILYKSPEIKALFGNAESAREFYVDAGDREAFLRALRENGEVVEHRGRFYNRDREIIWCAVSARLIRWEGEDVIVSHTRDLTAQLAIEEELAQQQKQIFQNEKMSALGSLLAGVAHELNNPLSVVVGHAMMLQDEIEDPQFKRQVGKISDAAERCAKIVKTFLTMARQEPVTMQDTDVNEVVATATDIARFGDSSGAVRIEAVLDETIDPICIDADQITQVVINLILNAEQAIQTSGTGDRILIRTEADSASKEVRIIVEDNGPGIPQGLDARVFDPFFTTKSVGEGTGIGLAVCHRIVAAHEGRIHLDPAHADGARFVVSLRADHLTPPEAARAVDPADPSKPGRILVVDDEADVADLNVEVLARVGFDAVAAYRAEDAARLLREDRFDAVISDLNMPGIDGRGFHEIIVSEHPDLLPHTGFITGDTMGQASQTFLREAGRPFLEKPVSPKELRSFVSDLCRKDAAE